MPIARRYGNRQVETRALPGVRKTAADTDLSRGAGLFQEQARTQEKLGQLAGNVSQITGGIAIQMAQEEKKRADEIAVTEATNAHMTAMNAFFYDPQRGAYTKKGKDAQSVPTEFAETFTKVTSETAAMLKTPEQRDAFREWVGKQQVQHDLSVKRHVYTESVTYDNEVTKGALENYTNAAILNANDPVKVGQNLLEGEKLLREFGARNGQASEVTKAAIDELRSTVHEGVIKQLLAEKKTGEAKAYMEELGDQLGPEAKERVTKALKVGEIREQTQEAMDKIRIMPGTHEEKLAYVRKNYSGELEDELVQEIEHDEQRFKVKQREADETRVTKARQVLDANPNINAIDPADWAAMSLPEASALRNYADNLSQQKAIQTNPNLYAELVRQATSSSPTERLRFTQLNIGAYVDQLSREDLKQFIDLQGRVRQGDEKTAQALLVNPAMQTRMTDEALLALGLDPTPPAPGTKGYDQANVDRSSFFRRRVREEVALVEQRTKAPVTDAEMQVILDNLRKPTTQKQNGTWWKTWEQQYHFETNPAQREMVPAATIQELTIDELRQARKAAFDAGLATDDATVLMLYNTVVQARAQARGAQTKPTPNAPRSAPPAPARGPNWPAPVGAFGGF